MIFIIGNGFLNTADRTNKKMNTYQAEGDRENQIKLPRADPQYVMTAGEGGFVHHENYRGPGENEADGQGEKLDDYFQPVHNQFRHQMGDEVDGYMLIHAGRNGRAKKTAPENQVGDQGVDPLESCGEKASQGDLQTCQGNHGNQQAGQDNFLQPVEYAEESTY